jgi:O-antigen/teichoic acid export membrane protein
MGRIFITGMVWSTLGLVASKFSTLLAQIALGWIFASQEYGVFATALAAAMIGDVLTDAGMRRVLITRGSEYPAIARTAFYLALGANSLGCLLMLGSLPIYRHDPAAMLNLAVMAIALLASTAGTIQRSKLAIDMRFARLAFMGTVSSVVRNASMVLFAVLGFGPLAFALPLLIVNAWETIYVWKTVGKLPSAPFKGSLAKELLGQSKWVILTVIGSSLIYRGDYLVASWLFPIRETIDAAGKVHKINPTGDYSFGFQLAIAIFSPLSIGIAAVIQPVMAKLKDDVKRHSDAFLRMIRAAVLLATPASMSAVFFSPVIVHFLWKGRWDVAIPVVQIIAATECVRQLHHICLATIDSKGFWKTTAFIVLIDGFLTLIASLIGCWYGSITSLAIAIAIERVVMSILQTLFTHRLTGGRARVMLIQLLPPLLIALPITIGVYLAVTLWTPDTDVERLTLACAGVAAIGAYLLAAKLIVPLRFGEAMDLLFSKLRKRPAQPGDRQEG